MTILGFIVAAIAVAAWTLSYRRSTAPIRDPHFFIAVSHLDAGIRRPSIAEAELIDEKHHLEARAMWPAVIVGILCAVGALFLGLGNYYYVSVIVEIRWFAIELVTITVLSAIVAALCAARTGRRAASQSQLYRHAG
ncbi:hypothetical protein GOEFS_021_00390 [Gordonia effusa NBRC 100432]|uniref:Uncharacterized protein n=1 Tax=Gordonia effusa NBRC 100432 TaxID=1077974 RepID=H0QWL1_9ACTN|nr:hypothetical protein [Gordonia effusa]GAB17212.1 hypothetical protein GOEFS_021_00390 [Gordonia effusa NBRC 100432]